MKCIKSHFGNKTGNVSVLSEASSVQADSLVGVLAARNLLTSHLTQERNIIIIIIIIIITNILSEDSNSGK